MIDKLFGLSCLEYLSFEYHEGGGEESPIFYCTSTIAEATR